MIWGTIFVPIMIFRNIETKPYLEIYFDSLQAINPKRIFTFLMTGVKLFCVNEIDSPMHTWLAPINQLQCW